MATHIELVRDTAPGVGQSLPAWRGGHLGGSLVGFGARGKWLALLRTVAIDCQSLQTHSPALGIGPGDVGGGGFARHVHRFGDRTRDEGLRCGHHFDVCLPRDRTRAESRLEGAVEDGQMLILEAGGPFDRVLLVDEGQNRFDGWLIVAQRAQ